MNKSENDLNKIINEHVSPPLRDFLIANFKYGIRIHSNSAAGSCISKLGGIPLIGKQEEWPRNPKTRIPLLFLMQINLSEIQLIDSVQEMPSDGLLSFYFDPNSWNVGLVKYYNKIDNLISANLPEDFKKDEKRRKLKWWKRVLTRSNNLKIFDEKCIQFEKVLTVPSWDSIQVQLFQKENNLMDEYLGINDEFIDFISKENETNHQIFGHYWSWQTSSYELILDDPKGKYPKNVSKDKLKEGLNWRLLAQIDSDENTKMNWMGGGKLLFFIKHQDLKKWKFDDIKVIADFT